jgi:hypothetical protein
MSNPIIETDLAEILGQVNQKLDKLLEEVVYDLFGGKSAFLRRSLDSCHK